MRRPGGFLLLGALLARVPASSRRIRQERPDPVRHYHRVNPLFSGSYFAGSTGGAPPTVLSRYIEQQHRPT
ncbi:transposase [Micromonospora sp. ATA32]|nr:transposase [Micromonospora sp. ATA32]